MLNCRQATELLCQARDGRLTRLQRLRLRLHVFLCRYCAAMEKNFETLGQLVRTRIGSKEEDQSHDALKNEVLKTLEEQENQGDRDQ